MRKRISSLIFISIALLLVLGSVLQGIGSVEGASVLVDINTDKEQYQPGETVCFTVTVTNSGQVDLTDLTVQDTLSGLDEAIAHLAVGEEATFNGGFLIPGEYSQPRLTNNVSVEEECQVLEVQAQAQMDIEVIDLVPAVDSDMMALTVSADSKLYEYGLPFLPDNGGSQFPSPPTEPRILPPMPTGGDYPDTVVVNKTAVEASGCRTYEVTLEISGDPEISNVRPIDLVVLIDVSGSMTAESPSVWTKGKQHAVTFAQSIASRADSYVAIVTFAHNMNDKGEGNPLRTGVGSIDGDTYLRLNFTNGHGEIQSGINSINKYSGGSNIESGLKKVLQIVDRENRSHSHKVIVLFTDGLADVSNGSLPGPDWPTHHNLHTAAAIAAGQAAWETARVYTVGLFKAVPSESREVAEQTLDWLSNAGFYEAVSEDDMERILDEVYTQIVPIATDAVVTDKIPAGFDLVPDSISGPGVYDPVERIITWDLGIIDDNTTLTYKIKANSLNPGGDQVPTNDWAKLNYIDVNGNPAQKEFSIPKVNVPAPLMVNAGPDRQVPPGQSIGIGDNLKITGGCPPYSYLWTCVADPEWSSTELNPWVLPTDNLVYTVTVRDEKGCTASDTVAATIMKGSITITKVVNAGGGTIKAFPIYVEGNGLAWSMLLADGESATIRGLEPGAYSIREVVPMDYRLVRISSPTVIITSDNLTADVALTNRKVNNFWFRDDDEVINTFKVALLQ